MALDSETLSKLIDTKMAKLKGSPLPAFAAAERKMLFDAIAQAVVEHLQNVAEVDLDLSATTLKIK